MASYAQPPRALAGHARLFWYSSDFRITCLKALKAGKHIVLVSSTHSSPRTDRPSASLRTNVCDTHTIVGSLLGLTWDSTRPNSGQMPENDARDCHPTRSYTRSYETHLAFPRQLHLYRQACPQWRRILPRTAHPSGEHPVLVVSVVVCNVIQHLPGGAFAHPLNLKRPCSFVKGEPLKPLSLFVYLR